jgi:hypothetical protein
MFSLGADERRVTSHNRKISSLADDIFKRRESTKTFEHYIDFKSNKELIKRWTDREFTSQIKSLNKSECDLLKEYTYKGDRELNHYLRYNEVNGNDQKLMEKLDHISNTISNISNRGRLRNNVVVYRCISPKQLTQFTGYTSGKSLDSLIGKTIHDKAFLSTSASEVAAKDFSFTKHSPYVLKIQVPKGTPCIYLGGLSKFDNEFEILIDKNQKLRINGHKKENYYIKDIIFIECELIPKRYLTKNEKIN